MMLPSPFQLTPSQSMQQQPAASLSVQPNLLTGKQHSQMLMTPNLFNQHAIE
jgi:hypothetical protein